MKDSTFDLGLREIYFLPIRAQIFFSYSRVVVEGDLNCYDSTLDKFWGTVSLSAELWNFKSCFNLIDAWRSRHAHASECTWFNSDLSIGSRSDSFLMVHELLSTLTSCEISHVFSDHDFVFFFDVDVTHVCDFGPGVWKFNNSLLEDRTYCDFITNLIKQHFKF